METNTKHSRSEGIAIAIYDMFVSGFFSSSIKNKYQVNSSILTYLRFRIFSEKFQNTINNSIIGIKNRHSLLINLGKTLKKNKLSRPSDFFDKYNINDTISVKELWNFIVNDFKDIWNIYNKDDKETIGDIWTHPYLKIPCIEKSELMPFHKISQWIIYSLIDVIKNYGNYKITDTMILSALPEYRNAGLLLEYQVITPKNRLAFSKIYTIKDTFVVELRGLTIAILEYLLNDINSERSIEEKYSMSEFLENGSWSLGREIAYKKNNGDLPINLILEGNYF